MGLTQQDTKLAKARGKLASKQVDVIVANDVSRADAGFDVETNAVTIISGETADALPLQTKTSVAAAILDRAERLLSQSRPAETIRV